MNFGTKFFQKRYFRWETEKNEHQHLIMHLRIRLGIKFQLKLIVLMFGPNLLKKGIWVLKLKEKSPWRYLLTYYIKLLCTGANRHNGILMSLLLLVTEAKTPRWDPAVCILLLIILYSLFYTPYKCLHCLFSFLFFHDFNVLVTE